MISGQRDEADRKTGGNPIYGKINHISDRAFLA